MTGVYFLLLLFKVYCVVAILFNSMRIHEVFHLRSPLCNSESHRLSLSLQHTSTLQVSDGHHPCMKRPRVLPTVQCDTRQTMKPGLRALGSVPGLQLLVPPTEEMGTDAYVLPSVFNAPQSRKAHLSTLA